MDDTFLSLLFTSTLSLLFPHFLYLVYRNVKTLFTVFFSLLFAALQTSCFYCSVSAFPFAVPYSVVLWKCFSLSVISVYYLFSDLSILFLFFLLFFIFSQNMFLLSENLAQNPFFPYASFRAVPCSSAALRGLLPPHALIGTRPASAGSRLLSSRNHPTSIIRTRTSA